MNNSKGSFTVEAAIVFSVVFLVTAAIVYIFIIMYQYTTMQSVADEACTYGAYYYVNQSGENYGIVDNGDLYWRIFDAKEDKTSKLAEYINKKLIGYLPHDKNYVSTRLFNRFLIKQLEISVSEEFPIPVGNLLSVFGIPSTISLSAGANSPLDDKAEFIRNMDTVTDIKNCIQNSDNKWIGKDSTVGDVLDKLLRKN
jgi:hypothetical protein